MDSEKKPKRPRIGAIQSNIDSNDQENRFRNLSQSASDSAQDSADSQQGGYQRHENSYQPYQRREGSYQPYQRREGYNQGRTYNRDSQEGQQEGGYQPRQNGYQPRNSYNQQGGYQPRNNYNQNGYQPRNNQAGYQPRNNQGGYQPRNNQAGYQPRNNQGAYQPRNNQGGYQSHNNQGGYQPRNNQGGYQSRNNQGGYQQHNNNQGGYQPRNNQGGYQQRNNNQGGYRQNNNRQGGFQQRGNNRQGGFQQRNNQPGRTFTPRPKQIDYIIEETDPNAEIRLNKFMANAGICSRREADEHITNGLVKVNGNVVTELGVKITRDDVVEYDGKVVTPERKCYVLLNKPKDCVTTSDDPNGRLTVLDLVKNACRERIYPVGRLDRNTTGVLLLTNDGDLASKLTHPKFVKKKIYHVWTDKDITEEDMQRIADGIELEDGEIHADAISYVSETDRNQAGIEIHSGRNRIVRRIFEHLGYRVTKLDRVYFAGLTKKNLPRGRWRYLTQEEVNFLRMGSFE